MWGGQVEACLRVRRGERPQPDAVVERAGEESVAAGADGEGGHGRGVAFEVAEEGVIVSGEISDGVVEFGGGVDDRGGVVCEAGKVSAIFLGKQRLDFRARFGVVELERVIIAGRQEEFARIVEVQGCDGGFGLSQFELLSVLISQKPHN